MSSPYGPFGTPYPETSLVDALRAPAGPALPPSPHAAPGGRLAAGFDRAGTIGWEEAGRNPALLAGALAGDVAKLPTMVGDTIQKALLDFGVDPGIAQLIGHPVESLSNFGALSAMGDFGPGMDPGVPGAVSERGPIGLPAPPLETQLPAAATPPFMPSSGGGGGMTTIGRQMPEFVNPAAPDFSRVEQALLGIKDPTAPVTPTDQELMQAGLAGLAAGAAQGNSVGEILALAGAGMFNAREMKKTAYDQQLREYEATVNQNARAKAEALAQIETHKAQFAKDVALAKNTFELNSAEMALRADIADASNRIEQMRLQRPEFHNIGGGMGALVLRGPNGEMEVKTIEIDPIQRQLADAIGRAKLASAMSGGKSDKTTVAMKMGNITSTFDQNDPMTPFLQMATVGLANANDPRTKWASEEALNRLAQKFGGLDEDGELPPALQLLQTTKPDEFSAELEATATVLYAQSLMSELGKK